MPTPETAPARPRIEPATRRTLLRRWVGTALAATERLLERREPALARRLSPREARVESVAAVLFAAVALGLPFAITTRFDDALTPSLLVLSYALVRRVRFPLGPGLIRPTQLVFVPMVFLLPAGAVPGLVALGSVLGELPEILRGRAHAERALVTLADGWYSVGPALVVGLLASGRVDDAPVGVLLAALAAQFATDVAVSSLREWLGAGIAPRELLPVLALIYFVDALLAPIGFLAVLASDGHELAYLLAIAPGALLGLIARERSERITRELALERAFRRSTRALDSRAHELRRQAGRLLAPDRRMGETAPTAQDRGALESVLLTTIVESVKADCGRLSVLTDDGLAERLTTAGCDPYAGALDAAEQALATAQGPALALAVGPGHVVSIARSGGGFSFVERDLLEHLCAQAAVSLENLHLTELMRRAEAELRAILEGVADAVAAEGPDGRLVYRNAAASTLLAGAPDLATRLGVPADALPGRRVLAGERPEPLVARHPGEPRWSRVKASPVLEGGGARLAISVIEDITEIKQAEEAHRFLAESSRALASLELDDLLQAVARLAVERMAEGCVIALDGEPPVSAGVPGGETLSGLIRARDDVVGWIALTGRRFGPLDAAILEDLGLRIGAAVDNARLYRTRAAIAQTLQASLLPPELPDILGLDAAAVYRPAGEGNEVGGDFYDVFATDPAEWFVVVGDVCGKGAEAAAVTALARYTIRAAATRNGSPAEVLRRLNAAMLRQRSGRFVTIACARLQLDGDGVAATVSCGGHPAPRVLRAGGRVEPLGGPGTLLGVVAPVELTDRATRLGPGDALILFTDGLTEAGAPEVWDDAELDAGVAGARGRSAEGIVEHLVALAAAAADGPLRDDLALLALRVQPLL